MPSHNHHHHLHGERNQRPKALAPLEGQPRRILAGENSQEENDHDTQGKPRLPDRGTSFGSILPVPIQHAPRAAPELPGCSSQCSQRIGERLLTGLPFDEFHTQLAMLGHLFAFVARQPEQNINGRGAHLIFGLMDGG